ncbi:MAG: hypothetical protein R2879_14030 [Saprospiraceae bacterium]
MNFKLLIKQVSVWCLAGTLVFAILLRSGHEVLDFHHESLHCDDSKNETHIHDERYAVHDCFVCAFQFSSYDYNDHSFQFPAPILVIKSQSTFLTGTYKNPFPLHLFLRGPPHSSGFIS